MRNTRQLHSWELADSDEESAVFVERVLNSSMSGDATKANLEHMLADIATKPNFAERASIAPFVTWHANSSRDEASSDKASLTHIIESQPQSQPRRPPIFGPEIVVQDPRVKAVHRQILYDLCVFTLCYTLVGFFLFLCQYWDSYCLTDFCCSCIFDTWEVPLESVNFK